RSGCGPICYHRRNDRRARRSQRHTHLRTRADRLDSANTVGNSNSEHHGDRHFDSNAVDNANDQPDAVDNPDDQSDALNNAIGIIDAGDQSDAE
ncbi:MAG TPA: hypothetical protein VKR28_08185, partial [Candidatus Binatus sp.]|nr:hypothetical protein [Candidatus Binatus sp.]